METTLPLLQGTITLQEALEEDEDIVQNLSYPEKRAIFCLDLDRQRSQIAQVVSRHLNIPQDGLRLGEPREWIHGSFNLCIPVYITQPRPHLPRRAIIRFPLPYKFTALDNEPFYIRIVWHLRNVIPWMSGRPLSPFFAYPRRALLEHGYLLIEHVDEGSMLSESWKDHRGDHGRRARLFRDLSRIMLSLAKVPLLRIGSWTVDDRGALSLTNRPLTFQLHQLENRQIPTHIPRDLTYTSVEPYYLDILACHDSRMWHQPNSIHHQADGEAQLAALTTMRALLPKFTSRRLRGDPFVLTLTDLHQSNILVDGDWHITRLIDLEWACVRPVEMLGPPWWLSSPSIGKSALGIDEVVGEELDAYAQVRREFMDAFEAEELAQRRSGEYTSIIQECWETGSFWYSQALDCPSALYAIFMFHIQTKFADLGNAALDEFSRWVMPCWDREAVGSLASKVRQQEGYSNQIWEAFAAASSDSANEGEA